MSDTYTCSNCGGTFEKGDDEAAEAEAQELWGVESAASDSSMAEVCDDCFHKFMAWFGKERM